MSVDILDGIRSKREYRIHNWDLDLADCDGYLDSLLLPYISQAIDFLAKRDYKDSLITAGDDLTSSGQKLYEPNVARVTIDTEFGRDIPDIDIMLKIQAWYKVVGERAEQDWLVELHNLANLINP